MTLIIFYHEIVSETEYIDDIVAYQNQLLSFIYGYSSYIG